MKKTISVILVLLMVIGCFTACGSSETAPAANNNEGARKTKDEIVFAQATDITTLNPIIGTQERAFSITNHMYDTLFVYDSEMQIHNSLCKSYEWVDDTHLHMDLVEGVKFHNGDPLTSEDVVFMFEYRLERGAAYKNYVSSFETDGDYGVNIVFSTPHKSLIYQMTDPCFGIIPKKYFQEHGEEYFAAHPIGSGPYKLKDFVTGDYYSLERFDDYWGEKAKTKYLTMKVVPEASQRTIMLETGEIDAAYQISYIDAGKIKDNEDLQLLTCPSMKIVMFFVNCESATPINNKLVRQAIEYAMDKQAIVDSVLYGYGAPAYAIVPDSAVDYGVDDANLHEYNLDKAKALMKEAGCEDGFDMEIWCNEEQANTELCTVVIDQLAKINIKAHMLVQDANTIDAREDAGDDFGMALHFFSCNSGHSEYTLTNILPTGTMRNDSRFSNAEYDELVVKWLQTTDEAEHDRILKRMYEIQNEYTPVIPMYNEVKVLAASKNLEGLQLSRIGAHEYTYAVVYED